MSVSGLGSQGKGRSYKELSARKTVAENQDLLTRAMEEEAGLQTPGSHWIPVKSRKTRQSRPARWPGCVRQLSLLTFKQRRRQTPSEG